jgi:arsenite methyltransferase
VTNIRKHVRDYYRSLYSPAGCRPRASVPIPAGKDLAYSLGYPTSLLDSVPESLWTRFLPCGYPLAFIRPDPHHRILNLGSGIGVDAFMIALSHNFPLHLVNLDVTESVLHEGKAGCSLIEGIGPRARGDSVVHWVCGDGERLPFGNDVFHWTVMNGVLNLFSPKDRLLKNILRVMIPGGCLAGADLCSAEGVPGYFADEPDSWAWCMSGACTEDALENQLSRCGFTDIDLQPAEDVDMFYRVTFSCRKPRQG